MVTTREAPPERRTARTRIAVAVAATAELTGMALSKTALRLMVEDLSGHPEADVLEALARCRRELTGRLTLAAVLERLSNQPPGAEEAWNRAVAARIWDESVTVVIEQAVFAAFPQAVWNAGDKIGARMAFREAYPGKLREHGAKMYVSLGWDRGGREAALKEAVQNGRVTAVLAARYLPLLADEFREIEAAAGRRRIAGPERTVALPSSANGRPEEDEDDPERNGSDASGSSGRMTEDERRRVREILAETRKTLGVQSEQPSSPGKRRTGKVRRPPPRPPSREEQQRRLQERMAKAGAGASQEEGA